MNGMKIEASDYKLETLTSAANWPTFKKSFVEYVVRYQFVRTSLIDLHDPDWNGRFIQIKDTMSFLIAPEGEELGPTSTASSASSAPVQSSRKKKKMASITLLIKRKALERLSVEQADYSKDCHKAMSFLFAHISNSVMLIPILIIASINRKVALPTS
jgi:hypothetical protein